MSFSEKLLAVVLAVALFTGSGLAKAQAAYEIVSTEELTEWMKKPDKPYLVFALSPIEFSISHIPGSVCIPLELMDNYYKMPDDLGKPMVFYCHGPG